METATHQSTAALGGLTGLTGNLANCTPATAPAVINPARLAAIERKRGDIAQPSELDAREKEKQGAPPAFVPLDRDTRAVVDTATAAYHLGRKPQTLRGWACNEDGPLRPLRLHGRLGWRTADLRRLLGVTA